MQTEFKNESLPTYSTFQNNKGFLINWSNLRSLEISQIFVAFSEYMNFKKFQNEDYFQRKLDEFDEQKAIIFVLSLHIHKS